MLILFQSVPFHFHYKQWISFPLRLQSLELTLQRCFDSYKALLHIICAMKPDQYLKILEVELVFCHCILPLVTLGSIRSQRASAKDNHW